MNRFLRSFSALCASLVLAATALPASDAPYYFALAEMYAAEGEVERAASAFSRAIELDPGDSYLRLEHAEFLSRRGLLRQAVREIEVALEIDGDNLEAVRLSGYLQLELAPRDSRAMRRAREAFERLRDEDPADVSSMLTLSSIYLRIGETARALDVIEESLSWAPNHPGIKSRLLEALSWGEQADRAERLIGGILEAEPNFLEGRVALARRFSDRGAHAAAIALLDGHPGGAPDGPAALLLSLELYRQATLPSSSWSGRQEDLRRSGEIIEGLLEQQPGNHEAVFLRALILAGLSRNDIAIDQLLELRRSAPDELQIRVVGKLAELLEHEGRTGEASAALSGLAERLSRGSDDPAAGDRVWLEVARLHAREGEWHEAMQVAERLEASDDEALKLEGTLIKAEAAMQLERYDEALAALTRRASGTSEAPPRRLVLKRAEVLYEAGRGPEGEAVISAMAGEGGLDSLLAAAQFYLGREDYGKALGFLERSMEHPEAEGRPELVRELVFLAAESLAEVERVADGLALLGGKRELFAGAGAVQGHRLLLTEAKLLEQSGQAERATSLRGEIEAVRDPDLVLLTVQFYQESERYRELIPMLAEATRDLEGDGNDSPMAVNLHFALGMVLERSGRISDAVLAFRRVLELNPDDSRTLNYLGYTWAEAGQNLEEALELIQRAVELDPRNGAYLDSLGWVYFKLDRYEEARGPLESAASLVPEDATILEHMGDLYLALDERDKALDHYRRAAAVNDEENVEGVRRKLARLETGDS